MSWLASHRLAIAAKVYVHTNTWPHRLQRRAPSLLHWPRPLRLQLQQQCQQFTFQRARKAQAGCSRQFIRTRMLLFLHPTSFIELGSVGGMESEAEHFNLSAELPLQRDASSCISGVLLTAVTAALRAIVASSTEYLLRGISTSPKIGQYFPTRGTARAGIRRLTPLAVLLSS